jgi:hypothetical protein
MGKLKQGALVRPYSFKTVFCRDDVRPLDEAVCRSTFTPINARSFFSEEKAEGEGEGKMYA